MKTFDKRWPLPPNHRIVDKELVMDMDGVYRPCLKLEWVEVFQNGYSDVRLAYFDAETHDYIGEA